MSTPFEVVAYGPSLYFVGGELDLSTVPTLEAAVEASVARGGLLVLDLSAVSFVDSTGVHALLRIARRLRGGCLFLHGVRQPVLRVFELVRITDQPNLHVQACTTSPYPEPEDHVAWVPADDLAVRLETLRSMHEGAGSA
jgi:anti-sigma B factor antagonist